MGIRYRLAAGFAAVAMISTAASAQPPAFPWPDRQRAAASLAYDDALPSQLDNAIPALDRPGLRGSLYLTLAAEPVRDRLEGCRAAARNGRAPVNPTRLHQVSAR